MPIPNRSTDVNSSRDTFRVRERIRTRILRIARAKLPSGERFMRRMIYVRKVARYPCRNVNRETVATKLERHTGFVRGTHTSRDTLRALLTSRVIRQSTLITCSYCSITRYVTFHILSAAPSLSSPSRCRAPIILWFNLLVMISMCNNIILIYSYDI